MEWMYLSLECDPEGNRRIDVWNARKWFRSMTLPDLMTMNADFVDGWMRLPDSELRTDGECPLLSPEIRAMDPGRIAVLLTRSLLSSVLSPELWTTDALDHEPDASMCPFRFPKRPDRMIRTMVSTPLMWTNGYGISDRIQRRRRCRISLRGRSMTPSWRPCLQRRRRHRGSREWLRASRHGSHLS